MKYSLCTSAPSPLLLVLNAYGQLLLHDIFCFTSKCGMEALFPGRKMSRGRNLFFGGIITRLHNYERDIDS